MQSTSQNLLLPETAAVKAILLAWPFADSDWRQSLEQAKTCYQNILDCFLSELDQVDIVVLLHPSISPVQWRKQLGSVIADRPRLKLINSIEYNDTWIRDYGPLSLREGYFSFTFDGWGKKYVADKDNAVAQQVLSYLGESCRKSDFVAEGGALEINSQGDFLANRDCLVDERRNPGKTAQQVEAILRTQLGAERFFWLENVGLSGDDTDGHIDVLARFSEHNGIVYCGENERHPDRLRLRRLHQQIERICKQQDWQAFALPVPVVRSELDDRLLPASYANFLIVNALVFVPIYGVDEDLPAQQVLQRAFPSFRLVPVNCQALLEQHGSLHCATMQLAKLPQSGSDIAS